MPGIDVDVRVELLHRDPEATGLEEPSERGGGEALPEAGGHSTGHEDVLRQDLLFRPSREIPTEGDRTRRPAQNPRTGERTGSIGPVGYGAGMTGGRDRDRRSPGRSARSRRALAHRRRWCSRSSTIVIRLPAFFAEKSLVFDDGVFASSARAMRNGELPFRDIFSSQGPVFLPLVWVADLVGFRTLDAPRAARRSRRACCSPSRCTRARGT